eukprot:TRINITY_DN2928_c0_g1_i1.p1 TRINITY_DN2928_c0_g1~~TRINITY_DN2928_c0_g1_i1.p1  ORF type:complete len:217 (+),score=58.59 TRINITY_DN2928_c0_g1_i1:343-993(+)
MEDKDARIDHFILDWRPKLDLFGKGSNGVDSGRGVVEMGSKSFGFLPFIWHRASKKECSRLEWIKTQLAHKKRFIAAQSLRVKDEKGMDDPHDESVCVLPGGKYGVDYECYLGSPLVYHSMYLMENVPRGVKWSLRMMMMRTRLAGLVKKTFVICLENDAKKRHEHPAISFTDEGSKGFHQESWRVMTILSIRSLSEIPSFGMTRLHSQDDLKEMA